MIVCTGKTLDELRKLEDQISDQLDDESTADPEYWSASLRSLRIWKVEPRTPLCVIPHRCSASYQLHPHTSLLACLRKCGLGL